jgi:hypothetical protein
MSAEDLAGDALVHLTQRLASVVPMKGSFLVLFSSTALSMSDGC